jgi:hypothetical protein
MLFEPGTYAAKMIQQSVWEKAETGTLNMTGKFDVGGNELTYCFNLIQKDGTPNTRTIGFLKDVFGWDGKDFDALQNGDFSAVEVDAVCINVAGTKDPTKMYTQIQWINKPGGMSADLPAPTDTKTLTAKYAAKFRALSPTTTKPTAKPAPAAAPAPTAPAAPKTPPKRPAAAKPTPSDEGACWEKVLQLRPNDDADAQAEYFWSNVAKVVGDKVSEITPEEWGKVMVVLNNELPF